MEEEVAKMLGELKFTDEEMQDLEGAEMILEKEVPGSEKWLVGKLVSPGIVDGPMLIRVFIAVWREQPLVDATKLGPNMFLFKFGRMEGRDFVFDRVPWTFNGELLALKAFDGKLSPTEYDFCPLPIWIRVYDLPLTGMDVEIGKAIARKFGECLTADFRRGEGRFGEYMRIRAVIDSSKPLRRCVIVGKLNDGSPRVCMAKYERLPRFCYWCGTIGHELDLCLVAPNNVREDQLQFGDWMRVKFKPKSASLGAPKPGLVHFNSMNSGAGKFKKAVEVVEDNTITVGNVSARGKM
ncbi:hypothetical protein HRI_004522400 [Hibiscus trionum]|uniref:CCHC-type domain-containing protein n=1 Tax=Hibiscus trionum TaxID=183268 RepID=A0A9W7MQ14_HIBTR|nr:hypothetical protein HRI_004522400 [Hibiscus trionum]